MEGPVVLPRHVIAMLAADGFDPKHPNAQGAASEREYPGLHVRVLSAPKVAAYRPLPGEVAISIRGRTERPTALSPRFAGVLSLVFEDTGAFAPYAVNGSGNPEAITAAQADAVAAFVHAHRAARGLVVHCTAGVSRSRSLAAAVCSALGLPYRWIVVNDDVYRAVLQAFARVPSSVATCPAQSVPLSVRQRR